MTSSMLFLVRISTAQCELPKDNGNVCNEHSASIMWYFDAADKKCMEFVYYGCDGNANRYDTKQKCLKTCILFKPRFFGQ